MGSMRGGEGTYRRRVEYSNSLIFFIETMPYNAFSCKGVYLYWFCLQCRLKCNLNCCENCLTNVPYTLEKCSSSGDLPEQSYYTGYEVVALVEKLLLWLRSGCFGREVIALVTKWLLCPGAYSRHTSMHIPYKRAYTYLLKRVLLDSEKETFCSGVHRFCSLLIWRGCSQAAYI
ncbi:hypothetical protein POVCU2_0059010 [Plasmodium ovale curtisi]|uniref:Uncharacterized protein n=1 Tax=Plasmodium ovale curtisi TaxID=864141 RepID=A0A1A8WAF2_PLAOA|nr:hypothetical protein POVCU2_0059010 [Plasmodium ovale curtisi]